VQKRSLEHSATTQQCTHRQLLQGSNKVHFSVT